jgi:hypothetical protein
MSKWTSVLWGVFALLLLFSGIKLLFGCELTIARFLGNYCPVAADTSAIDREVERRRQLEDRIQQAQIQLAQTPPCATCTPRTTTQNQEFALLLDVSGSMSSAAKDLSGQPLRLPDGTTPSKWDLLRRDLPPALSALGRAPIHYMEVGTCSKRHPLQRMTVDAIAQRIRTHTPTEGESPFGSALLEIANVFRPGPDGSYFGNILIITDVGPECGEDPCAAARTIAKQKPGIRVNVVDMENSSELQCVSKETGGTFFTRGSNVDLKDLIRQAREFPDPNCPPAQQQPRRSSLGDRREIAGAMPPRI